MDKRKIISFALSAALHIVVAAVLVLYAGTRPVHVPKTVITAELVRLKPAAPPKPAPEPEPMEEIEPPKSEQTPLKKEPLKVVPKKIVPATPDDPPPPPEPVPELGTREDVPENPPEAPAKTQVNKGREPSRTPEVEPQGQFVVEEPKPGDISPNKVVVRSGGITVTGKSGEKIYLSQKRDVLYRSFRSMAYPVFTEHDYVGHYQVRQGEVFSVIDLRDRIGHLALYESGRHLLRILNRFSNMIYNYGPGFTEFDPVEGSITFLTNKWEMNNQVTEKPSRLMWIHNKGAMEMATKQLFREDPVVFRAGRKKFRGMLMRSYPVEPSPCAIIVSSAGGPAPGLVMAYARMLAKKRISFFCLEALEKQDFKRLGEILERAMAAVGKIKGIIPGEIGILGIDQGALAAAKYMAKKNRAAFLAGIISPGWLVDKDQIPSVKTLANIKRPCLWLLPGPSTRPLVSEFFRRATNNKGNKKSDALVLSMPESRVKSGIDLEKSIEDWLYRFGPACARHLAPWISGAVREGRE